MNISNITDLNELKAMAYDQIAIQENTANNLRMINERIAQVSRDQEEAKTPVSTDKKKS